VPSSPFVQSTSLGEAEKGTSHRGSYSRDKELTPTLMRVSFGEYVQTLPSETDNSMSERSNGCIALLPCGNASGTVMFYHLATKRVISRDKWVALPMPDSVINFLNDLAAAESGKSKLPLRDPSFTDRGKLILDSSQPEHVDTAILRSIHEERSALRHANTRSVIFDENQLANHIPPPLGAGRVVSIDDDSSAEASSDTSSRDGMIDPQGPQDDAQDPPDDEAQDFPDGDAQDPPEDPSHPNPRYFSVDNISIEAALLESPDLASGAINDELQQMVDKGVFVPSLAASIEMLSTEKYRGLGCDGSSGGSWASPSGKS
jgi:hypothetical protein